MIPEPHISDHALLRFMERIHGIDIKAWRKLMVDDLRASLEVHDGEAHPDSAVFLLSPTRERVVSVLGPGQQRDWNHRNTITVARVEA
jgi:hypothetical protein